MLKIFLSSHGSMASGIKSSLEVLLGPCDQITVFDAYIDETSVQQHLDSFYRTVAPEDEVLLCSDLYGGSVNQAMFTYLDRPNTRLVTGVNLTFMMNLAGEEDHLSDEHLQEILDESREYLRQVLPEQPAQEAPAGGDDFF